MSSRRSSFCLAHRPDFPRDLQVLLVEPDLVQRNAAEELLSHCSYQTTSCSTAVAAVDVLLRLASFDVLLADARLLAPKTPENAKLLAAAKGLPLVLMADNPSPSEVLMGIKLGAVDFMVRCRCRARAAEAPCPSARILP